MVRESSLQFFIHIEGLAAIDDLEFIPSTLFDCDIGVDLVLG